MAVTADVGGTVRVGRGPGLQGQFSPNDINLYINPAADPRLNSILSKTNSPLRQGIIQQTDDSVTPPVPYVAGPQKFPYACRFMFNPTTLDVTYRTDESAFNPALLTRDQAAAVPLIPGTTSISFSLLFDRTYEVAYGPGPGNPRDMRDTGVYQDIAALERVVGARYEFAPRDRPEMVVQPMQLRPCYFVFGGGSGNVGLTFIGAITNMSVTYTSFSERMVPVRAAVSIDAVQFLGRSFQEFVAQGGTLLQRSRRRTR